MNGITGFWIGYLPNVRLSVSLALVQKGGGLQGVASFSSPTNQIVLYECAGKADANRISLELSRSERAEENADRQEKAESARFQLEAELGLDGRLTGTLTGEEGTSQPLFLSRHQQPLPPAPSAGPDVTSVTIYSHEKQTRIPSSALDLGALRQIYHSLVLAADEAARLEAASLSRSGEPHVDESHLRNLYAVSVIARGSDGDQVMAFNASVFSEEVVPQPLRSVEFEVGIYYRHQHNRLPLNRASLRLDFSKPPVFDLTNPSGSPTPNESFFHVIGNEPIWVSGTYQKVLGVISRNKVRTGWLHWRHIYDVLLFLIGFPVSLPTAAFLSSQFTSLRIGEASWFGLAYFLFFMLLALIVFRLGFSTIRWLLPYVEFSTVRVPLHRQIKVGLSTLILGALGSLVATAIWVLIWAT